MRFGADWAIQGIRLGGLSLAQASKDEGVIACHVA